MTPKEKAKELIHKMFMYAQKGLEIGSVSIAKQAANVAVDEIIDVIEFMAESDEPNKLPYWKQVKNEINEFE